MDDEQQPATPTSSSPTPPEASAPMYVSSPQLSGGMVGSASPPTSLGQKLKEKVLPPIVTVLILILFVYGGVLIFQHAKNSSKPNCVPPTGSTVTKAVAITEYGNLVKAIKTANQTCANSLSSSFFLYFAREEFGAPKGNWITANPAGLGSIGKDLSKLPNNLSSSQFVSQTYKRAEIINPNGQDISFSPAQGLTLRYPAGFSRGNGHGQSPYYFFASFVSQKGKIVVDYFVEGPAATD